MEENFCVDLKNQEWEIGNETVIINFEEIQTEFIIKLKQEDFKR